MRTLLLGLAIILPYLAGVYLLQVRERGGLMDLVAYHPELTRRVLRQIRSRPRSALCRPGILLYLWAHLLAIGLLLTGILTGLRAEL